MLDSSRCVRATAAPLSGKWGSCSRKEEVYNDEQVSALGTAAEEWNLFVDGYCPSTGKRVRELSTILGRVVILWCDCSRTVPPVLLFHHFGCEKKASSSFKPLPLSNFHRVSALVICPIIVTHLHWLQVYDKVDGVTCHQCRQKTLGKRTSCSECQSLFGNFCGDCLYMRYGENINEVAANPEWTCPCCRDLCNCSFHRSRAGWAPTGTMYRYVLGENFHL